MAVKDFYTLADLRKWKQETPPIRLGVFGDPVTHSLSPKMQNAALEMSGLKMRYAAFHILPNELSEALGLLSSLGFVGVNLTVPHKVAAAALVQELEPFARDVGAINTISIQNGKLIGCNTDGPGFARAIRQEFSVDLRDLRVLLLGAAGGAGRAIAQQCAHEGCERLVLVNRDSAKAKKLADALHPQFQGARVRGPVARLEAIEWNEAPLRFQIANTDLLVNATPLGMKRSDSAVMPSSLLAPHLMVYDTIYTPPRTPLLAAASEAGARGANGLSMLLHQGALAFEKWFEREAPIDAMRAALNS
ncbi:MAG: shikimate dehydrogenase [Chthoniobacterales bacterium]